MAYQHICLLQHQVVEWRTGCSFLCEHSATYWLDLTETQRQEDASKGIILILQGQWVLFLLGIIQQCIPSNMCLFWHENEIWKENLFRQINLNLQRKVSVTLLTDDFKHPYNFYLRRLSRNFNKIIPVMALKAFSLHCVNNHFFLVCFCYSLPSVVAALFSCFNITLLIKMALYKLKHSII